VGFNSVLGERSKDPKIAYKTINARVETVDTAPSYRQAFKKRRCLIPVDGFYEWKKVVVGKIPYSIGMKDDSPFVFAGLWGGWKDPATEEWLHTCTIITGEPNELVAQIHTRMPVILAEEHHNAWLTNQAGKEVLTPFPAGAMRAWPISPRVNSPKNNDPQIMSPPASLVAEATASRAIPRSKHGLDLAYETGSAVVTWTKTKYRYPLSPRFFPVSIQNMGRSDVERRPHSWLLCQADHHRAVPPKLGHDGVALGKLGRIGPRQPPFDLGGVEPPRRRHDPAKRQVR
jgi:putative SOS response-associated peptidase YedK